MVSVTLLCFQYISTLGALKKLCNTLRIMEVPFATFQPLLPAKTALFSKERITVCVTDRLAAWW
jgi:hypothetical protein